LKKIIYIFILGVLFISCKTQSNIVTSKKTAKEQGIYSYNEQGTTTVNETNKKAAKKTKNSTVVVEKNNIESKTSNEAIHLQIVETAINNIGVKYKTGGTTTAGMDCSGLVYSTYKQYNKNLPRSSNAMANEGTSISKDNAKPGDLIFFKTNGRSEINHVGIITEVVDDEIKFVHSSTSKGVIISSTKETYYGSTFTQINRIIE
jgi:cell wall-associated NlpC family hydrolase